ncbi:MAG: polysaccharide deacetylase family protein [Thermodesulforhabdaceae bacterium]|jgi:hypothetical protein
MNLSTLLDIIELPSNYRAKQISPVWHSLPKNWLERLERVILSKRPRQAKIFFRADDVGVPSTSFLALCRLFAYFNVPLALSVVPSWLNESRTHYLFQIAPPSDPLWSWHQHGWRHTNWEKSGKKSEFGPSRTENQKWQDIWKGLNKMKEILDRHFVPAFTPPWNRLTPDTFILLSRLGFRAVSLDQKIHPPTPENHLKNFRIFLDLHTRKPLDISRSFDELIDDCRRLFSVKEPAGIMIHHNRMNLNAFLFLANFMELVKSNSSVKITSFKEMLSTDG